MYSTIIPRNRVYDCLILDLPMEYMIFEIKNYQREFQMLAQEWTAKVHKPILTQKVESVNKSGDSCSLPADFFANSSRVMAGVGPVWLEL